MAEAQLKRGELFTPELVNKVFNMVTGKSSLVRLSGQTPIGFNGTQMFTFNFDSEVDIVAEGGAKSHGGVSYGTVKMVPLKVEYGARVTDEFLYASQDQRLNIMKDFNEGFAKKLAKAIDLMAIHGINPRSGEESQIIGNNAFVKAVQNKVPATENADTDIETAVDAVMEAEKDVTGLAVAPKYSRELSRAVDAQGNKLHPELAWAGKPSTLKGLDYEVNSTVGHGGSVSAIVGDFRNGFKWGFAKEIIFKVLEAGDPDNTGRDLAGHNEVYLRCEAYIGWGILTPDAFAIVEADPSV